MTKWSLKEYTQKRFENNPYAPAIWINARELLGLLERVEAGDAAQARLATIEAEECPQDDLSEEHSLDEVDYGDLEPGQDVGVLQGAETLDQYVERKR